MWTMDKTAKDSVTRTYIELVTRGEILKAQKFINEMVPLWLKNDETIASLREEVNKLVNDIRGWHKDGREYPGIHAVVPFSTFPKFTIAKKLIEEFAQIGSILDIGCYSGVFLKGIGDTYERWGIDIHKKLLEILREEREPISYVFGTAEDIPLPPSKFNIVTAFDVLEHTLDLDRAIEEIERVCKPGGLIIVNLPQMTKDYVDEVLEHTRMFDEEDISRIWGHKKGFKMEDCVDELGRPTWFFSYRNA